MAGRADPLGLTPRALYFLLSYAAELYDPRDELFSGEYNAAIPAELLFRALSDAAAGLIRRGADRMYVEESSFGASIRGRIDMGCTIARDLGMGVKAVSVAARLSPSCPQNNAIKTALSLAEAMSALKADTRERARSLAEPSLEKNSPRSRKAVPRSDRLGSIGTTVGIEELSSGQG